MDRIIAETAGHLPEDSYKEKEREDEVAVVTSASPVHQQASQVNGHDNGLLAKPVSAKRQGSVDVVTCTPTDEELQKPSPQQPALRSRSNSLTRLTSTPVEKIEQKRLIDASVEAVEKEGTLLTPMEIITIVDEVHQKMYPCHTEEEWKTSGISTLRVASHHYDTAAPEDAEEPHPGASPRIDDEPEKPQEVVDLRSSEAAKPRRPVSAGPAPPSPPRPLLFPGLDLLCDVMLDNDSIDAFTPWKMFLSAVMEVEINDASSPSSSAAGSHDPAPFVRRLYEGHRNAMLSRDYLDNVLWRVNRMHHGVVNALELIPTRWKSYSNSKELEDEEISEVIFAEVIAREKLIQDQISEFCNVLHYSHVRRGSVNTAV
ncbi:Hypothetical protein, putative [Bodo saltans]|uniref:Uncharacterized protein n=1 Tax=Bodo saltans TaxID=75058 RepID=A0A0S4JB66_BODSA|nr:Hypothetical protein, putative [Bodo saltans]|eukprot:CUG88802.1 Hypothetical protein, putative [Bodo saltans]